MLQAVTIGSLLVAAAVAVRWTATRTDVLGRRRSFPVIGVAVPLLVAVVAGVPVVRHARTEARLAQVAAALVGHQVTVRCETLSQAWTSAHTELGYVRFDADGQPEPLATLTVDACSDLSDWMGDHRGDAPQNQVVAVHVLTHEAMHLAGERNEARAECAAVQRDARTAALLGATPAQARAVAWRYWRIDYPTLPDDYRTADCAPGAALDEGLEDAPWSGVKSS
jgi:hypothetical protein